MRVRSRVGARRKNGSDERVGSRPDPPFLYSVAQTQVAVLDGKLELGTIAQIESAAGQSSGGMILDLTAVEIIANDELAGLAAMLHRLLRNDASVAVVGGDPRTRRLLAELDLDGLLLAPTIHLALASIESTSPAGTGADARNASTAGVASACADGSHSQRIRT